VPGTLKFTTLENGRRIEVRRSGDVSDDFWRVVRAEWGQNGQRPSVAIYVLIEEFASRNRWLLPACKAHKVGIQWDELTLAVIRERRAESKRLPEIRRTQPTLDVDDARARAVGSGRFRRSLKWFQERDLAKLLALDHGANFSVPGAGKTTVELAVYQAERDAQRVQQLLVVAPLSAFDAWMVDSVECLTPAPMLHRFDGGTIPHNTEVLLVNYQRLAASYAQIAGFVSRGPTLVVLDEAHRMKRGREGEWGTACLDLAFSAARRDVLSGTPAPQHPSDMVALLDFLWPGQARQVMPAAALVTQPPPSAIGQVTEAISPLFVRTTKHELDLKEPIKRVIPVELSGLHRQIYNALRRQYAAAIATTQRDRLDMAAWGNVIMYLLEAATNPALLPAGSSSNDPIEFRHPPLEIPLGSPLRQLIADYASYETPAKFIQLAAKVRELRADGRKVLIWSNFVRNLETLERQLAAYEPALVHGGIPSEISQPGAGRVREREIERFRTDESCGVLLANPAAMSEGISLHQVCHDAIYLDRTFNAGQFLQSVDRIHRLGLDPSIDTTIYFLMTRDTIDEEVNRRVERKAQNLGTMLDDPGLATMALPDDEDYGSPIDVGDVDDIAALFAHLRGDDKDGA
jgi:hypothetical protein